MDEFKFKILITALQVDPTNIERTALEGYIDQATVYQLNTMYITVQAYGYHIQTPDLYLTTILLRIIKRLDG